VSGFCYPVAKPTVNFFALPAADNFFALPSAEELPPSATKNRTS
jgi:hypothetical protein